MNEETWKSLKGVVENGDNYEVSSLGKVRNVKYGWMLKQTKDKDGYLRVQLNFNGKGKTFVVRRLVAFAFLDKQENKNQVNHIDGIKTNNKVDNLEWVTNKENHLHARAIGLVDLEKVKENAREVGKKYGAENGKKSSSKPVAQYDLDGNLIAVYKSQVDAAKKTGLHHSTISIQCIKQTNSKSNFYFRFAN